MAGKSFDVTVFLRAVNQLAGPIGQAKRQLRDLGNAGRAVNDSIAIGMRKDLFGSENLKRAQKTFDGMMQRQQALLAAQQQALMSYSTIAKAAFVAGPIAMAVNFEDQMAQVRKVTGITFAEMKQYGREILQLSTRLPITAKGLSEIMTEGARMGIRGLENLKAFTETVAKVATAWDGISASQAAGQLSRIGAKFFSNLKPDQLQKAVRDVADAINELANRSAFADRELLKFFDNASAGAKRFGLTANQLAAWGGASLVLDQPSGQLQGTRAQMTFSRLAKAALSPNKKQLAAFKRLDLKPSDFKRAVGENAQLALLDLMSRLGKIQGIEQIKILGDLLSDQRAARQMQALLGNMNEYKRQLAIVDDAMAKRFLGDKEWVAWMQKTYPDLLRLIQKTQAAVHRGSVDQEFANRMQTVLQKMKLFGNAMRRLAVTFGEHFLEPLGKMTEALSDFTNRLSSWAEANPKMAKGLAYIAAGLMALTTALVAARVLFLALGLGVLRLAGAMAGLTAKTATATGGLALLIGSLRWLAFTPWGRAIVAAISLVAWKWKELSALASNFKTGFMSEFNAAMNVKKGGASGWQELSAGMNDVSKAWKELTGIDFGTFNWEGLNSISRDIGKAFGGIAAGGLRAFASGLKGVGDAIRMVKSWIEQLRDFLGGLKLPWPNLPGWLSAPFMKGAGAGGPKQVTPPRRNPGATGGLLEENGGKAGGGGVGRFGSSGLRQSITNNNTKNVTVHAPITVHVTQPTAAPGAVAAGINKAVKRGAGGSTHDGGGH